MVLKRKLGAISLLFVSIGGMVGSGWLFGPFYAAQITGPAAILAWILGGILMMVIALTFAELSAMFPVTGGMARFIQFSHGPMASFTLAWIAWLAAIVVAPIETMALVQYASTYVPGLMQGHTLTLLGIVVSGLVMLSMCFLNSAGTHLFSKTNNGIIIWKLIIPAVTIVILFSASFHVQNFTSHGFMPMGFKGVVHALPVAGIIFSFIGYSPAIQLAGEAKNPQRAVPFAILGSISFCIGLFVLIQVVFVGAISPSFLGHGWAHLQFKNDVGPIAGLLTILGFVIFVKLLYIDAVISPFGTALIYTAATSRMNFAMSQNGYLPKFMQDTNKNHVPYKAMWVNFVVGLLFFLPFPGWQKMVSFLVSCFVLSYAVGPIALIALRQKLPDQNRPFRLPYVKVIAFVAFYICNLIVYWTSWDTISKMLIVIIIGYVILFVVKKRKVLEMRIKNALWLIPYLAGVGIISYFGAFKGKNDISFGEDFIVILIFSAVIFALAYFSIDHDTYYHEVQE